MGVTSLSEALEPSLIITTPADISSPASPIANHIDQLPPGDLEDNAAEKESGNDQEAEENVQVVNIDIEDILTISID